MAGAAQMSYENAGTTCIFFPIFFYFLAQRPHTHTHTYLLFPKRLTNN